MASKLSPSDIDNIVKKYRSGLSAQNIGERYGVSVQTITTALKRNGISIRGNKRYLPEDEICQSYLAGKAIKTIAQTHGVTDKVISRILSQSNVSFRPSESRMTLLPEEEVVNLYRKGIGAQGIADKFGCSRQPVLRILKKRGVELRDRSDQQQARMNRASPSVIAHLTKAAHEACAGITHTEEHRCKVAAGREKNRPKKFISPYELKLARMLLDKGIPTVPQKAIGRYNCDLAAYPVAVEIFGGHWHWHGNHIRIAEKRFRYIMDRGWSILAIHLGKTRFPLTPAVADYVAAYIKATRTNPPLVCEYRVIWGAGEFSTGGSLDDDTFSIEPPFTYSHDPVTGQYKTVPR